MSELSTKEKILLAAHQLFAEKGRYGVSVREIASASEVNVAAINYHFNNKENLYAQTILSSIQKVEQDINNIHQQEGVEDPIAYAQKILDYFMENSQELRSVFIMLSSSHDAPQELLERLQQYQGPPGGQMLARVLSQVCPRAEIKDLEWAVRSIMGIIMHKSMIMANRSICSSMEQVGITVTTFRDEVGRLTNALIKELNS